MAGAAPPAGAPEPLRGCPPPAAPLPSPPSPCQVPMDFPAVARSRWTLRSHSENQSPIIAGPLPSPPRSPTLTSCPSCQVFTSPPGSPSVLPISKIFPKAVSGPKDSEVGGITPPPFLPPAPVMGGGLGWEGHGWNLASYSCLSLRTELCPR